MIGDTDYYTNGVEQRRSELASSAWLPRFWALLDAFGAQEVREVRCLALGLVCDHLNPRFQLALLLLIVERYGITKVTAWDPIFTNQDREVLEHFGIDVVESNPESGPDVLWYIPHGPLKLIKSMPAVLGKSIYLGNDLTQFDLDSEGSDALSEYRNSAEIKRVPVNKHDRWSMAFNAMAIHQIQSEP